MTEPQFYPDPWPETFRFMQVAWVVDDILGMARRFVSLYGAGPFHVMKPRKSHMSYRGESVEPIVQIAVAQMGPVQVELIQQHCDTETIYTRELRAINGVHHLCTFQPDYDAAHRHYARHDCRLIAEITMPSGKRVGYFDTLGDLGVITEVVEEDPGLRSALNGIAATCRDWDGSDPIRLLTRDGYEIPA